MIILTIEIGTREAIGVYALAKELKLLKHECIVLPRFVLPRLASFIKESIVIIDGAREVKGRRKLLTRLRNNNNTICLFDTEGFVLKPGAFETRYPQINVNDIDLILTWGAKIHNNLVKNGLKSKLIKFGNPQFSYFQENAKLFQISESNKILITTAFAAADIVMKRTNLDPKQISITRKVREKFMKFIENNYSLESIKIRVHPNEKVRYYKKKGFKVVDSNSLSSFEDIINSKEVIGVNCTTLVEGALLGKKVTNVIFENNRHGDIELVCHNINQLGMLLDPPKSRVDDIIFTSKSGYSIRYQAEILAKLDKRNIKSTILIKLLIYFFNFVFRFINLTEAKKYNYNYVKSIRKIYGN